MRCSGEIWATARQIGNGCESLARLTVGLGSELAGWIPSEGCARESSSGPTSTTTKAADSVAGQRLGQQGDSLHVSEGANTNQTDEKVQSDGIDALFAYRSPTARRTNCRLRLGRTGAGEPVGKLPQPPSAELHQSVNLSCGLFPSRSGQRRRSRRAPVASDKEAGGRVSGAGRIGRRADE